MYVRQNENRAPGSIGYQPALRFDSHNAGIVRINKTFGVVAMSDVKDRSEQTGRSTKISTGKKSLASRCTKQSKPLHCGRAGVTRVKSERGICKHQKTK
jgi:hypothetical protein